MRRLTRYLAVAILVAACVAGGAAAHARGATTICVGSGNGCYQALQPAFDAAHNGDTVKIGPGTFAGGATVDASVTIVGAGAGRTVISGGAPVLTIGVEGAIDADKLKVSIAGLTITGGDTSSVQTPDGPLDFLAVGGGIVIPGGATSSTTSGTVGATVTIRDSAITGNRASPASTTGGSDTCLSDGDCPFAFAAGGGIVDVGRLTLIHSVVSDNVAGGPKASSAAGGGIWTATNGGPGALTLIDSIVERNRASVTAPNGQFAEGGGIEVQDGEAFVVRNSTILGNTASVSNTYPADVEMNAGSGGIRIGGFGAATFDNARISGNTSSYDDPSGSGGAGDAGLGEGFSDFCDTPGGCGQTLDLKNTVISDNHTAVNRGSDDNNQNGGAVEIDSQATIENSLFSDNTIAVTNHAGPAAAVGAFLSLNQSTSSIVVRNSAITGNTVSASTDAGPATIQGAGVINGGNLELHNVAIRDNSADAEGQGGFAQGAGIWNGQPFGPDEPSPQLTLDNTHVTRNVLTGSAGVSLQGGGLFTPDFAVTLTNSRIEQNVPDQCFGC
jgi:hypothetical protein